MTLRHTLHALAIATDDVPQLAPSSGAVDRATGAGDAPHAVLATPSVIAKRRRSFGALRRLRTLSGTASKAAETSLSDQLALVPMSNGAGQGVQSRSRPVSGVESKRTSTTDRSPTKRRSAGNLQGPYK